MESTTAPWTQLLGRLEDPGKWKPHADSKAVVMGCRFSVVKNPPRFSLAPWRRRTPNATLFANVDAGTIDVYSTDASDTMDVVDVHVEPKGVRHVVLLHHAVFPRTTSTTFDLVNPVYALEFIATVYLMQHVQYIQARKPKSFEAHHDSVLMAHMQNTIDFATAMWTLALWKDLFPYSRLKENLTDALAALPTDVEKALSLLDATYRQFYAYATVTETPEDATSRRHCRASYVGLLVAKVKALHTHLAQYCTPTSGSKPVKSPSSS